MTIKTPSAFYASYPIFAFDDYWVEINEPTGARVDITFERLQGQTFTFPLFNGIAKINLSEFFQYMVIPNIGDKIVYGTSGLSSHAVNSGHSVTTYNAAGGVIDRIHVGAEGATKKMYDPNRCIIAGGGFNDVYSHGYYWDDNYKSKQFILHEQVLDIWNGLPFSITINLNQAGSRRLQYEDTTYDFDRNPYSSEASSIVDVSFLYTEDFNMRLYINWKSNDLPLKNTRDISLCIYNTMVQIKENYLKLRLHKRDAYCSNAIYLRWLNPYGGWDYHLFQGRKKVNLKEKSLGEIDDVSPLVVDKSLISRAAHTSYFGKAIEETIDVVESGLDKYTFAKLLGLTKSPKVYMFIATRTYVYGYFEYIHDLTSNRYGGDGHFIEVGIQQNIKYRMDMQEGVFSFTLLPPQKPTIRMIV